MANKNMLFIKEMPIKKIAMGYYCTFRTMPTNRKPNNLQALRAGGSPWNSCTLLLECEMFNYSGKRLGSFLSR